jgi:Arc/MetJ-type ribon-helix-helix transcriptional regulator
MPRSKTSIVRKNIRIPKQLMDAVDHVVTQSGLYLNRQQFVESAIREKVENHRRYTKGLTRTGLGSKPLSPIGKDSSVLVGVKESFLMHTIVELARGKGLPSDHVDPSYIKERIRSYIIKKAQIEGKELTEEQADELTSFLFEYHKELLQSLSLLEATSTQT